MIKFMIVYFYFFFYENQLNLGCLIQEEALNLVLELYRIQRRYHM